MKSQSNTFSAKILCFGFVLYLFLPLLQQTLAPFELPGVKEGRKKMAFPSLHKFGVEKFTTRFERYYNDNFGFRDFLIKLSNSLKFHLFGVSSTEQVLIGKDGWLFLTAGTNLDSKPRRRSLTQNTLQRKAASFQKKSDTLAALGIKYLLVIAPDKNSIYPEYYPAHLKPPSTGKYEQFLKYMREHTTVALSDIKPRLLSAKTEGELYFRGDSHWNDLGAFFGYLAITEELKRLFPNIKPSALEEFKLYERPGAYALVRMLGIFKPQQFPSTYVKRKVPDLWYNLARKQRSRHAPFVVRRNFPIQDHFPPVSELIPKGIVYRDSFFARLASFVSYNFAELHMYSTQYYKFDLELIKKEQPSIVIEEIVERNL